MADPLTDNEMRFHCENGHQWRELWPMPMRTEAFTARMKASAICPTCEAKVFLGWGPQPVADASKGSMAQRANAWISGGDTGASSKAIWAHMMDAPAPRWGWDAPSDPDDLGRCLRLLEAVPEWKPRIPEMATRSDKWAALAPRWDEIAQSMADEVGIDWSKGKSAPQTYRLMRSIFDAVRQGHAA